MDMVLGYTLEQIRQMDVWMKTHNLTWKALDERYLAGIKMGSEMRDAQWNDAVKDLLKQLTQKDSKEK